MKNISEILDIILITYNRAKDLDSTLSQILSKDSPIKDFEIKIIDNNSTDNTADIIKNYQKDFSNLKYQKNKYNIGGNANIMRAFELAEKKYVWIICDNDYYNWEAWNEVEKALNNDVDAFIVSNHEHSEIDLAQKYLQATFLPSVIYKTSLIDTDIMTNMAYNISNMFPHLVLFANLINTNKNIEIVSKSIVSIGDNSTNDKQDKKGYVRGLVKTSVHPNMRSMSWLTGYANSTLLIQDKKKRAYVQSHSLFAPPALTKAYFFFDNERNYNRSFYNICNVFCALTPFNKVRFIINLLCYLTIYRIIYIYYINKRDTNIEYITRQYRMILFGFIKANLFKIKYKNKRKKQ